MSAGSSFNTSLSFVTNTNRQGYGGQTTMSHLTQMAALTVQNFVSAAVGIAVLIALVRGFYQSKSATIGNFLGRTDSRSSLHPAAAVAGSGFPVQSSWMVEASLFGCGMNMVFIVRGQSRDQLLILW